MSYPAGWKIVLEDKIGSDGYYLEIEKSAVSETKFIVGIIEDVDLQELFRTVHLGLNKKFSYLTANLTFKDVMNWNTSGEENILQGYRFEHKGEFYHGLIYCYNKNERSIMVIKQEKFSNRIVNTADFELI